MIRNYVKPLLNRNFSEYLQNSVRYYYPRRAQLYVPGDSQEKINKTLNLDVDSIALDCEDGVASSKKSEARKNIRQFLDKGKPEKKRPYDLAVRFNAPEHELEEDIREILTGEHFPDTVILPKVDEVNNLKKFAELLDKHIKVKVKLQLIMGIESALSFISLRDILLNSVKIGETSKFLPVGVFFGSDDFCASIGATRTESSLEVLYPRLKLVVTAKGHGLQVIDMVYINYKDLEGLKKQAEQGAQLGFTGKQVIHPDQVPIVQTAFFPTKEKIRWAENLLKAFDKHQESGKGAFVFEGQMIDMPTMRQAQNIMDLVNSIMIRDNE